MRTAKFLCALAVVGVFASMVMAFSRWNEHRGIYDDVCYFRQSHLFQKYGPINGLDTDLLTETDGYLRSKLQEISYPYIDDLNNQPCHHLMPATGKMVMQYPPGTGYLLAIFPEGNQAVPLFFACTTALGIFAIFMIALAPTPALLAVSTFFGGASLYLMNNPVKSSYSLAPTVVICAVCGLLTAAWFRARTPRLRLLLVFAIGASLGASVNLRIANGLLAMAYGVALLGIFLARRRPLPFFEGAVFALGTLIAMLPTLAANHINAGSIFTFLYDAHDNTPPDFSAPALFANLRLYIQGTQGLLILTALLSGALACTSDDHRLRQTAMLALGGLIVPLVYFLSHVIFTPYYMVPAAILCLWTLMCGYFASSLVRQHTVMSTGAFNPTQVTVKIHH
ncbi:hypothetical protein BH11PSE4_BH11PSE4_41160 [soil metagenome]